MSRVESKARGFHGGDVIADRYELRELVGEGGMGAVWRALHIQLESDVALKLMSPAIAAQPEALHRFLREARAAARLTSLHVVKVFDFGVHGETPFIVMELLTGESLRQRLDREGALSPKVTSWVMRHATRALSKAHGEGIVHRDLKPENLFITTQEEEILKVLDFGVAKLSGAVPGSLGTSTRTGAVLGTPFYMSPEQARGIKAIDHRSDIWSLGVIAYECLTGKLPFDSEGFGDLVLKICTSPPPVPSSVAQVPAGFDAWFARAVEREPEQRYQSVDEMYDALQVVLHGSLALATTMNADGPPVSAQVPDSGAAASAVKAPALVQATSRGTLTDGTAAQSVMVHIPKRGLSPRAWVLSVTALSLVGVGAVWILGSPPPSAGVGRPPTAPATSAVPREALVVALEEEPADELEAPASGTTPVTTADPGAATPTPALPPSEPVAQPTVTPVLPDPTASTEASPSEPLRAITRPASPAVTRPRPPAPKAAKRAPAKAAPDLFSNPD
jgi:eukaryotic-like serine/threonine-protein kinase